jgi:hypothetical protein
VKFKGIIEFEYELSDEEVTQIESSHVVGGDYPAEFYEQAEREYFDNDPHWFMRNRVETSLNERTAVLKANVISRK